MACAIALGAITYTVSNWDEWISGRRTQWTQNAFVKSEPAVLSARVGGYVRSLPVADYQMVKAGQIIAEIESDDYVVRVQAAEASLAKAQAVLDNLGNEEAQQRAAIEQAVASLHASEARLTQSQQDFDRKSRLVTNGTVSGKSFDDAKAELASAKKASREAAAAALTFSRRQLDTLAGQRAERRADLDAATAALASAKLEFGYTRIIAPFDGVLGRRSVQIGSLVGSGTQIVAIVPLTRPYVIANYKGNAAQERPGRTTGGSRNRCPSRISLPGTRRADCPDERERVVTNPDRQRNGQLHQGRSTYPGAHRT